MALIRAANYDNPNFSEWNGVICAPNGQTTLNGNGARYGGTNGYGYSLQTLASAARTGNYGVRVEVRNNGCRPLPCSGVDEPFPNAGQQYGPRAQCQFNTVRETNGNFGWYTFSVKFDSSFPDMGGDDFSVLWQAHSLEDGPPPIGFYVQRNLIVMQNNWNGYPDPIFPWGMPFVRNQWLDFKFYVLWSSSTTTGKFKLWVNNQPQIMNYAIPNNTAIGTPGKNTDTLTSRTLRPSGASNYIIGSMWYMGHSRQGTYILYSDNVRIYDADPGDFAGSTPAPVNQAPVANFTFTPTSPLVGQSVTFTSTSTDPDNNITSLKWDYNNDGTTDATGSPASTIFNTAGSKLVTLLVTDAGGLVNSITKTVVVASNPTPVNQAPTASFTYSPSNPVTGTLITFTDTSVDPDGTIASRAWDLDNDGAFDDGTTNPITKTFTTSGVKTVRLQVTDNSGAVSVVSQDILVEIPNVPDPTAPGVTTAYNIDDITDGASAAFGTATIEDAQLTLYATMLENSQAAALFLVPGLENDVSGLIPNQTFWMTPVSLNTNPALSSVLVNARTPRGMDLNCAWNGTTGTEGVQTISSRYPVDFSPAAHRAVVFTMRENVYTTGQWIEAYLCPTANKIDVALEPDWFRIRQRGTTCEIHKRVNGTTTLLATFASTGGTNEIVAVNMEINSTQIRINVAGTARNLGQGDPMTYYTHGIPLSQAYLYYSLRNPSTTAIVGDVREISVFKSLPASPTNVTATITADGKVIYNADTPPSEDNVGTVYVELVPSDPAEPPFWHAPLPVIGDLPSPGVYTVYMSYDNPSIWG